MRLLVTEGLNMKILTKVILLMLTLLPFLGSLLVFLIAGLHIQINVFIVAILMATTILAWPGMLIFYLINVFRNTTVVQNQKVLWAVLFFFGGILVFPVYWYLHIWRDKQFVKTKDD